MYFTPSNNITAITRNGDHEFKDNHYTVALIRCQKHCLNFSCNEKKLTGPKNVARTEPKNAFLSSDYSPI